MAAETVSGNLIAKKKKTFKWLEFHCQNQAIGNTYSTIIARNLRRSYISNGQQEGQYRVVGCEFMYKEIDGGLIVLLHRYDLDREKY